MRQLTFKSAFCALVVLAALAAIRLPVAHGQGDILVIQAAPAPVAAAEPVPAEAAPAVDPADAIRAQIIDRGAPIPPTAAEEAAEEATEEAAEEGPEENDPQLVAIRQQFEPLMKTELSFANRVCQWTDAERIAAIAAAKSWQRDFAREFLKNGGQRNRGMMIVAGNQVVQRGNQGPQPEKSLADALQSKMTDEQRAAYEAERTKRDAFRAGATIDNLVAKMDQKLELTPQQRRQIRESLREDWSEDWAPPLELFVQMAEYSPAFPDEKIVQFLTPEQRALWQRVRKLQVQGGFFGGNMFGNEVPPINDVDLNEGQ